MKLKSALLYSAALAASVGFCFSAEAGEGLKANGWKVRPEVSSWTVEDIAPAFLTPEPIHGRVRCYYDKDPNNNRARPETPHVQHYVTYVVDADEEYEGLNETYPYFIGFKTIGPKDNPYGYRVKNLTSASGSYQEVALVFTNTSFSAGGPMTYSLPSGVSKLRYLVLGGGGSGAKSKTASYAGNGESAAYVDDTVTIGAQDRNLQVVVGFGGSAQNVEGANGAQGGVSIAKFGTGDIIKVGGAGGDAAVQTTEVVEPKKPLKPQMSILGNDTKSVDLSVYGVGGVGASKENEYSGAGGQGVVILRYSEPTVGGGGLFVIVQ